MTVITLKHDMLSLFNQLTSTQLADCNLFNDLIHLHYEKFKYLYYILKDTDISNIHDITCSEDTDSITVTILSPECAALFKYLNERQSHYNKKKYFNTSLYISDDTVHIIISMVGAKKEAELYASGLI